MFRKTLLTAFALILLGTLPALAETTSPTPSPDAAAGSQLTDSSRPAAPSAEDTTPETPPQLGFVAMASGHWLYFSSESCIDLIGQECTSTLPSPQCPNNPAGKRCSPLGSFCYNTISAGSVDIYRCR